MSKNGTKWDKRLKLAERHGMDCHWCGNPMLFDEPVQNPWFPSIEHLDDAVFAQKRTNDHNALRLAHRICNQRRNRYGIKLAVTSGDMQAFDAEFDHFIRSVRIRYSKEVEQASPQTSAHIH